MMRLRRRCAGWTLIELMVTMSLLICVLAITFGMLAQLTRLAAGSAAGAAEIALVAKMSEAFRNDVRQAKNAVCSTNGDSVKLKCVEGIVEYLQNADGRIERRVNGQFDFTGPFVFDSKFALQASSGTSSAMVRAAWTCRADAPATQPDSQNTLKPAGRILVLDTALRAEGSQ